MAEPTAQTFNHFSIVTFTDAYWTKSSDERRRIHRGWIEGLRGASDAVHLYQSFGTQANSDLLVWCARRGDEPAIPHRFFTAYGRATASFRPYLAVREAMWGFTLPSPYTKARSPQEIDPFAETRLPYLIMYPFVKTPDWYLKDPDERQSIMAEHIKIGKQYKDITQLLLYSFGLQDQEFVVVYETRDLVRFLSLVKELRGTEARTFTERDFPLHSAIHQSGIEALEAWL